MKRREFLARTAFGLGAAWVGSKTLTTLASTPATAFSATDTVVLGKTGIKTSRLAMGTGTVGAGHHSHQTALGIQGLADLLRHGYDQGLRFFDLADSYGSHPHAREALNSLPREKVTVMTKSWARDAAGMRADLERFRQELNTDYIDLLLMHCLTEDDWTDRYRGAMDVLSEAREKGLIRAHGCSCHTIGALRAATRSPWVQVHLVRMNPVSAHMDADPQTVLSVMKEMRAAGKGIIGMKILGQGAMRGRVDEALKYALSLAPYHDGTGLGLLDAFTIGAESRAEQEDLIRRIAAVTA